MSVDFKVGDKVEYELNTKGEPFWSLNTEIGDRSGEWFESEVLSVDFQTIQTTYPGNPNEGWFWYISNVGSPLFQGYVRKLVSEQSKVSSTCKCSAQDLMWCGHMPECPEKKKGK